MQSTQMFTNVYVLQKYVLSISAAVSVFTNLLHVIITCYISVILHIQYLPGKLVSSNIVI